MTQHHQQNPQARFSIGVVENASQQILLLKRVKTARIGPGLWGFPAGRVEAGESPPECMQRELNEEIGHEHTLKLLKQLPPLRDTQYGGIYEIHLFHFAWLSGHIVLNAEHTEHAWVARGQFTAYPIVPGVEEDLLYLGIWSSL